MVCGYNCSAHTCRKCLSALCAHTQPFMHALRGAGRLARQCRNCMHGSLRLRRCIPHAAPVLLLSGTVGPNTSTVAQLVLTCLAPCPSRSARALSVPSVPVCCPPPCPPQLKRPTIRAKLIRVTPSTINTYLGASSPFAPHLHASRSASSFE